MIKRWLYHFGFRKHYVSDNESLVFEVLTTKASTNEIANLEEVLDTADLPEGIALKADKGYQSKKNGVILKKPLKTSLLQNCRNNLISSQENKN